MSRSNYSDYDGSDNPMWAMIRWRGAVHRAVCGKRGQAFIRELREALDKLETKRLIADALEADGEVCALGAVGKSRGLNLAHVDPEDDYQSHELGAMLGIAPAMAAEIMWLNDELYGRKTPEERYRLMRLWAEKWSP